MTPQIATVLVIIAIMSISFFFELLPLGFTALMVPVLLQGTGILNAQTAWAGLSNTTVITWIGLFIIGAVFAKTSFTYRIRVFIQKNTKGSPLKVFLMIIGGITIMGLATTATAAIAALTPIITEICKDSGLSEKRVFKSAADLCTWVCVQCFPIGSSISYLLLFNQYLTDAGSEVQFGLMDFTWIKLPMFLFLLIYYIIICRRFVVDKDASSRAQQVLSEEVDYSTKTPYTPTQEKLAVFVFVANVVLMVAATATNIVPVYLVSTTFAALAVGLKLISQKDAFNSVSWGVIFLVAGTLPLSSAMTSSGTGEWISNIFRNAFPGLTNPIILATIFCAVTMVITQFMSNAAVIAIFSPIAATMALNLGIDPRLIMAGVACGSIICFATPMAGTAEGYVYGVCDFNMKDFIKIGWIPCVILIVAFAVWAPFVLNLIY